MIVFVSTVPGCVLISPFALLVAVPEGITSSAVGIKMCAINGASKRYEKIIKKKKKKCC